MPLYDDGFSYGDNGPIRHPKKKKKKNVSGWYFPPEIVAMFYSGKVNPRELVVLGTINSLTKTDVTGNVEPCFASNAFISRRCRISAFTVSRIISKLAKLGVLLVTIKAKDRHHAMDQRMLRPCWRVQNNTAGAQRKHFKNE